MTIADRNSIELLVLWRSQKEMTWLDKERKREKKNATSQGKDTIYVPEDQQSCSQP